MITPVLDDQIDTIGLKLERRLRIIPMIQFAKNMICNIGFPLPKRPIRWKVLGLKKWMEIEGKKVSKVRKTQLKSKGKKGCQVKYDTNVKKKMITKEPASCCQCHGTYIHNNNN